MMITAEIVRNIGRKMTLEMMLTGRRLNAEEAKEQGLINRYVPHDLLESETLAFATEIAARSPAAISLGLSAFYESQDMEFEGAISFLEGELAKILTLEDAAEGIAAFLGKRKPQWKGR